MLLPHRAMAEPWDNDTVFYRGPPSSYIGKAAYLLGHKRCKITETKILDADRK
jgi:hypothetical protein